MKFTYYMCSLRLLKISLLLKKQQQKTNNLIYGSVADNFTIYLKLQFLMLFNSENLRDILQICITCDCGGHGRFLKAIWPASILPNVKIFISSWKYNKMNKMLNKK